MKYRISIVLISFALFQCKDAGEKLFTSAPPSETGITFANAITVGDSISVLDSEYLFNGGGVAVGDINNDGLLDIYFSGNMTTSRL